VNDAELIAWLLLLLRTAATVAALAPFTHGPVPAQVKIGLAAALTLVWAPVCAADAATRISPALHSAHVGWSLGWLASREALTGLGIAWVLSLWFVPLRVAGAYIGQEMGLTLGGIASPVDQQQSTVITQLVEALGTLAFFLLDLHHLLFWTLRRLLDVFPVAGSGPELDAGWIVRCVSGGDRVGLELAAPIGILLFILLVVTLLLNRTVPQLNLLSFGMPLRLGVGLALLLLLLPQLLQRFIAVLQGIVAT
jgi:flagellar biosynthetic protein FliR